MNEIPRLDILIYAHDGRGLGHASRSIGVGLALRRLYPHLKVLFVSGCNFTGELVGTAPLDWLKLPSYQTRVVQGKSVGVPGKSLFSDADLGQLRTREMAHLISLYRPRLVLVDHTPQGKHRELVQALSAGNGRETLWILGVRGVVGSVRQVRSELAAELFKKYYHGLLWYGDSCVLGSIHRDQLQSHYGVSPVECGYVLRLAEMVRWDARLKKQGELLAGIVSVPWLGEKSRGFLVTLIEVLKKIPQSFGRWRLFVDTAGAGDVGKELERNIANVPGCSLEQPGINYISSLLNSKMAIIYGGYNSLMDVIYAETPSLVILREMEDEEQLIHLRRLKMVRADSLMTISESKVSPGELERLLLYRLQNLSTAPGAVNIDGAASAAAYLKSLLD